MPHRSSAQSRRAAPTRALWYEAPGLAALREVELARPEPDEARVATLWSGVSRGTERLVFEGRVPPAEYSRMRAPMQAGEFPYPVKFGYCAVGLVEAGPDEWLGRTVFALHPHQDRFVCPVARLAAVPDGVPARRAILAANMETALNALWDAGASAGDRIAIVGGGVVGLLVAALAARLPGAEVSVVDMAAERARTAELLGAKFRLAGEPPDPGDLDADIVFHTSASSAGLAEALSLGGLEALIVEMSWYGSDEARAALGEAFHSRRLTLTSSQVGQVAPSRRPRWSPRRRLAKALSLLRDERLDALIDGEIAFADLPRALPRILSPRAAGLATAVRY